MLGWKEWARPLEAFHQLAEEAGLGLAFKRVAFPGAINPEAQSCIASFPGKYSELWDDAVAIALEKHDVCSLACVFLTDTASGLGRHAANPDCPGDCWCRALYGTVPPIAYLSVVDPSCEGDELAFKQADAAAMGQHLLVKKSHTSTVESDHELANALQEAQRRERNERNCPGQWKKNIHRALELHQTLHVFYFEGRRGLGKLSWDELGDQAAKDRARKNGGLGASQTAEVAYLDKLGVPYVEHDIAEFYSFVSQQSVEVSVDDSFIGLVQLTQHFVARCRPQQLANALWSCAVLMFQPVELLTLLCRWAVKRLSNFVPQNVSNSIWALATLGFVDEELLELVPKHVEANLQDYSPQDLSNTCWAFARLQRPCDALFRWVLAESVMQLSRFQPQNMSNLVWACATVMYKDEEAMMAIAVSACARVAEFGTQELSNLTWGLATLGIFCEDWMEASGAEMMKHCKECVPQDLSNTLWAYGTLKHKRNEHIRAINWEVMRQIEWFSPQGLSNVIWGLSAVEYRDMKALTCISEEILRRPVEQLTPPDISTLLYSFAVLAWTHEDALRKLRRAVLAKMDRLASRDVANVSWAMVTLSLRDDRLFRLLMEKAEQLLPEFTVTGLCNVAWAFVRFGLPVSGGLARGLAQETLQRREELFDEPGDAVLLADAVCSEWSHHVEPSVLDRCDAIGRWPYQEVLVFLEDWTNIPTMGNGGGEVETYQSRVTGFKTIQLGQRMSCEMMQKFNMLEDDSKIYLPLRRMREDWLLRNIQVAYEQDPTDATMKHKTTCTWQLTLPDGSFLQEPQVVASGTAMDEPIRLVHCLVEHPRANDAEFQVLNKAADKLLTRGRPAAATLHLDVSETPCLSCLGALRQFQKAFPEVSLRASFSIRKVCEISEDCSSDLAWSVPGPPATDLPAPEKEVLDNRGRGRAPPTSVQATTARRKQLRRPPDLEGLPARGHVEDRGDVNGQAKKLDGPATLNGQHHKSQQNGERQEARPISMYEQVKRKDWAQSFY
ncbi:cGMP-dependent protein kinase [Durusdinium trenchii]|uniref:cGMP-dependent protein kinase n=1 Tax=Durusdinium trenchii TaxID=1381693 RepID=A0ABP0SHG2_9DINO